MDLPLDGLRAAGRRLRARARVTDRLRDLSPVPAWRSRTWGDLLGLNRTIVLQAVKIGVSSALAWMVSAWLLGTREPIYAPLSATFVGLITLRTSVRDGIQRVIGVLVGIGVAAFLVDAFGLHSWSIGIVVALGYLAGKVLHMAPGGAAQIPVTGLLLLAYGAASHPVDRVLETLIGAAMAVLVNFVIVPPNHVGAARTAMHSLSDQVVDVLSDIAAGIAEPWTLAEASGWLRAARDRGGVSASAQDAVEDAGWSLRLHPRRGEWRDVLTAVRRAARTLGVVEVEVRVIARTLRDTAENLGGRDGPAPRMIGGADSPVMAVSGNDRRADSGTGGDSGDETSGERTEVGDEASGERTDSGDGASGGRTDSDDGASGERTDSGDEASGERDGWTANDGRDADDAQPPLPMAADMLTSTAGAIQAFTTGLLPTSRSGAAASLGTARAAVDAARGCIERINADLAGLVEANLPRGIHLGTLVVETGRILDELEAGLS